MVARAAIARGQKVALAVAQWRFVCARVQTARRAAGVRRRRRGAAGGRRGAGDILRDVPRGGAREEGGVQSQLLCRVPRGARRLAGAAGAPQAARAVRLSAHSRAPARREGGEEGGAQGGERRRQGRQGGRARQVRRRGRRRQSAADRQLHGRAARPLSRPRRASQDRHAQAPHHARERDDQHRPRRAGAAVPGARPQVGRGGAQRRGVVAGVVERVGQRRVQYVWLAASSRVKGEADRAKYNKARALARIAPRIRASYEREFASESVEVRQRATALWMIDVLALRVGNEKGEDEAETYGACSLLVEHVTLTAPASLKLSFLGKDSMPYENTVQVPPLVYRNIAQFVKNKRADESLFDTLTTSALNKHLKSYMDGLTAKCFRTYNASVTLERQLAAAVVPDDATNEDKLLIYNGANRAVAILCNHQRTVSKTFDESMQRVQAQLDYVLAEQKYVQKMREYYKTGAGAEPKPPKPLKDDAKPIAAPKDVAACNKRLDAIDAKLKKMNFERSEREENKTIALSTSKLNYMDPRITAAFCKRVGLPIEKVFAKTLRAKFPWALDVEPDWKFFDETLPADANITFDGEVDNNNNNKKKKTKTTTTTTSTTKRATSSSTTKKRSTPAKKKKKQEEESEEEEEEEESEDESEEEDENDESELVSL